MGSPLNLRGRANGPRYRSSVIPTKSIFAEMTSALELPLSSIAAASKKSRKDFTVRYSQWASSQLDSPPSRQSLLSREQSREGARFSIPAALRVLVGCVWPNGIAEPRGCHHVRFI
jgi:hypothetical protein